MVIFSTLPFLLIADIIENVKYARIYKEEEMEAYTSFAEVYDTFMDNVPYEEWADYLEDRLKEYGIRDGLVLELGCGTGSMTELLAEKRI